MKDMAKKILEDTKEILNERIFSPMYFYFIIAWIITNWSFVYTLIFVDEKNIWDSKGVMKIEYLKSLYNFSGSFELYWSISELFIIPICASFAANWWLSKLSEVFYRKYEEHKQEGRMIMRELEYKEKVKNAEQERKIRDAESDKNKIRYIDNDDFNNSLDGKTVNVAGYDMLPSEILYNTDYEAYRDELGNWNREGLKEELRDEIIDEHNEDLKSQMEYEQSKDK